MCGECVLAAHPPSQHSHVEINEVAYQEARANIGELRDQCNEVLQQIHWQIGIHKSKDFTQAKKNLIRSQVSSYVTFKKVSGKFCSNFHLIS